MADEMTDKQFEDIRKTLLLLVLEILKHSDSISDAVAKIEALLEE